VSGGWQLAAQAADVLSCFVVLLLRVVVPFSGSSADGLRIMSSKQ
jgi:hypothetical protein